ncbi:hypothetical protein ACFQVC_33090 [Streptomyces monticola]|uniref:Transposase n=1 Tax=Streptomyces monticola TaxID=2666263 RepID=A0ABW2JT37_9ACTN
MENTRIAQRGEEAEAPLTDAEEEQARYALDELARSERDRGAPGVSHEQLELVRPFFELGWVMGVRTGHTGPAMAHVPVSRATVDRAFVVARSLDPQGEGPVLWQKVRYHGSLRRRHGVYWVQAIKVEAGSVGRGYSVRYDLCEVIGGCAVPVVTSVRRQSLTPLPDYRVLV